MKFFKIFTNLKNFEKVVFWISFFSSIILLIVSFCLPPTGAIDPSVLAGVGEIFAYVTLAVVIVALGRGTDVTLHKGDIDISLNNPDSRDEDK